MPIGSAGEEGRYVKVYDERGRHLFSKPIGMIGAGLHGFTSSTVSIRESARSIKTYDERGRHLKTTSI